MSQKNGLEAAPSQQRKTALAAEFDRIFPGKTGFVSLDRLLARLHANKAELLKVLARPDIPLSTFPTPVRRPPGCKNQSNTV